MSGFHSMTMIAEEPADLNAESWDYWTPAWTNVELLVVDATRESK